MKTLVRGVNGFNPYKDLPTIVAVDYDGVIWDFEGKLVAEAVKTMYELSKWGVQFIVWTCRSAESMAHVEDALRSMGINIIGVNVNHPKLIESYPVESRKVFAHKYVDDQAMGWNRITWKEIQMEVISYQVERILKGEIDLKGEPVKMDKEVKSALKLLKDFGVNPSKEEIEEWKTWTVIQLDNHVKTLIKRKLGDD